MPATNNVAGMTRSYRSVSLFRGGISAMTVRLT